MTSKRTPDQRADRLASRQHGVLTHADARRCGLSPDQIRHRVETGRYLRLTRGVYAVAGSPAGFLRNVQAACLASSPPAVASHLTVAALTGLWPPMVLPYVTVPPGASARQRLARVFRSRLEPIDRTVVDGIPCTTPARMLVDCAGLLEPPALARLVDATLAPGVVTCDHVLAAIDRAARGPGRAGSSRLRAALEVWTPAIVPGSPAEARLLRRIVEWGFPRPTLQIEVRDAAGRFVARLDGGWPELLVGYEYDSRAHHGPRRYEHHETRYAALAAVGWAVRAVEASDLIPGEVGFRNWLRATLGRAA
jgi:Transcriptional regulator, AbiEi antitoxin